MGLDLSSALVQLLAGAAVFAATAVAGRWGVWGAAGTLGLLGLPLAVLSLRSEDPVWRKLFTPLSGGPLRLPTRDDGGSSLRASGEKPAPPASFEGRALLVQPGLYARMAGVALMGAFATLVQGIYRAALLESELQPDRMTVNVYLALLTYLAAAAAFGAAWGLLALRDRRRGGRT